MTDDQSPIAGSDAPAAPLSPNAGIGAPPAFEWKSYSRFVAVYPVETGWLVLWGRYEAMGRIRVHLGHRIYLDLDGVRERVLDAVRALTGDQTLVQEADILMGRAWTPAREPARLPEPL
jgi:hypothetical protein